MITTRNRLFGVSLIAFVAAGAPALAQTAPPAAEQPAQAPAQQSQPAASSNAPQTIVVTGSRIARSTFTSTAPVQVITSEQSQLEGLTDTGDILQSSTAASGSAQINNFFTGFVTEGGPGVNTVSLRGLGANRSLVLLNGRRLSGAGTRGQVGAVDLNVLPDSVISRIDILKDGASSIYGSDAVAGVVNVITRTNIEGFRIEGSTQLPLAGGGETFQISAAYGWKPTAAT